MMATPSPVLTVPVAHAEERVWTVEEVRELAIEVAEQYGLHKGRFLATLECENHFNAKGQSNHYLKGVREDSWGAAQINLPYHSDVTRKQAEDPVFALNWMAMAWLDGNAKWWTCYRTLVSGTPPNK